MSASIKIRRALLSVYDKTGLVDFACALHEEFGIELISTGGTAKVLKDAGLPVTLVEEVTGFPEMLDGRVKTLHPKIHAAILADRDNPEHMRQLKEQGIEPIDMVVVNLYPFEQTIAKPGCAFEEAIEMIDIGGPCLLRAAAKNHRHVLVIPGRDFGVQALSELRERGDVAEATRRMFAAAVYRFTAQYDTRISGYLLGAGGTLPLVRALWLCRLAETRYGENPAQAGALYFDPGGRFEEANLVVGRPAFGGAKGGPCVGGSTTEMSFNNYADASAALELCAELTRASPSSSAKLRFAPGDDSSAKLRFAAQPTPSKPRFRPIGDERWSRRNLPHWQVAGATYWVTFTSRIGVLAPAERDVVMAALRHWDGKRLDLHAATVMPDHVHAILTPRVLPQRPAEFENLSGLLKSIKSYSGRKISEMRGGVGQAWVHESHDRWLRSAAEFREKWHYLADNVVKEGLAATPDQYPWWYAVDFFDVGVGVRLDKSTPRPPILGGAPQVSSGGAGGEEEPQGPGREAPEAESRKAAPCIVSGKAEPCATPGKAELCTTHSVCFIKHTNPCGAAVHVDPIEAYRRAYLGDPNAAMGGILAVNFVVTPDFAAAVMETYQRWGQAAGAGGFFVEVWLAPSFDEQAVRLIRTKKEWGQRVRLLAVGDMSAPPEPGELDFKRIAGGMLVQTRDLVGLNENQWQVVTQRQPTQTEMDDLRLAWLICKHTKSNAITICKDGTLIGNGAGQMSRVMSCRIATWLALENKHADQLPGAVAASDAFFPFRDGPQLLMAAGVTALVQPGGSKRDADTIQACDERGVAMVFTGTRHFKH